MLEIEADKVRLVPRGGQNNFGCTAEPLPKTYIHGSKVFDLSALENTICTFSC